MKKLDNLFDNNKAWAARIREQDPDFFSHLGQQQTPEYLWIGCSDSRVPANQIIDLMPGEVFVHRNIANVVVHTDLNCLSVLQYAVEVLKVQHVIVCGHYGCGGVKAAWQDARVGLVDNWLRHVQDVAFRYEEELAQIDPDKAVDRLCELNVIDQVANVCRTTIIQDAWDRGQEVTVHGWIYGINDGSLHDTGMCVGSDDEFRAAYRLGHTLKPGPRP